MDFWKYAGIPLVNEPMGSSQIQHLKYTYRPTLKSSRPLNNVYHLLSWKNGLEYQHFWTELPSQPKHQNLHDKYTNQDIVIY